MSVSRKCKRCDRPCRARVAYCEYHWLMRQPAHFQTTAADLRLENAPAVKVPAGPDEKFCEGCLTAVPRFYWNGGLCKGCSSRKRHAVRVEEVYGITGAQYNQLLTSQGGRCYICGEKPGKIRLAVDHNHKTGEVRGLLCKRDNHRLLGAAKEDPEILRRAADYLENPPARSVLVLG